MPLVRHEREREQGMCATVGICYALSEIQSERDEASRAQLGDFDAKGGTAGWGNLLYSARFCTRARKSRGIRVGLFPGRVPLGDGVEKTNRALSRGPELLERETGGARPSSK